MGIKLYTPQDVAKRLGVSYITVYRWIQSGKLRAYQLEKQYRIDADDLHTFMEKGETVKRPAISSSLSKFIGTGQMDYAYSLTKHFPVDLTLGVNPLGCSEIVYTYYKRNDIKFTEMPDPTAESVTKKIASVYGFEKDEILVGAGAGDLLQLSYITFLNPYDSVVIPEITFPPLEYLAILMRGTPQFIPFTKSFDIAYEKIKPLLTKSCKIVALCNPNNPTGRQLDKEKVETLIKEYPDIVFLIDEANIDFGGVSLLYLTKKYPNMIVVRSFTKGFGLPGLRIGFAVGQKEIIYALKRMQKPFSTNIFAQQFAKVALDDLGFLEKTKNYISKERIFLENELTKLGYSFASSDSNLLLVDVSEKFPSSKEFIKKLNEKGANVVDGSSFRGLGENYVRLSVGLHKTNTSFITILKSLEEKQKK